MSFGIFLRNHGTAANGPWREESDLFAQVTTQYDTLLIAYHAIELETRSCNALSTVGWVRIALYPALNRTGSTHQCFKDGDLQATQ